MLGTLASAPALLFVAGCAPESDRLVVYCAHDEVYSREVLSRFERETGITVAPRFDTEATKSLGLTNLLIQEKENPRCDLFWNNQTLGTIDLKQHGVLEPYKGAGYKRIPPQYKDPEGYWTGFAARLRVYIVNTERMEPTEQAIQQRLESGDLSRMAVAQPMYGTTLSHYAVLWDLWGPEKLKEWHRRMRAQGVREVSGNATAMNLVAQGTCDFAWTDTDDFFVAKDRGDPVAMVPLRVGDGRTICIPNSVAVIKGTEKKDLAARLVDYLLSAENELALARSKSRQIPLGPVEESELPDDVRPLKELARDGYDLTGLGEARAECLRWLKSEYLR